MTDPNIAALRNWRMLMLAAGLLEKWLDQGATLSPNPLTLAMVRRALDKAERAGAVEHRQAA